MNAILTFLKSPRLTPPENDPAEEEEFMENGNEDDNHHEEGMMDEGDHDVPLGTQEECLELEGDTDNPLTGGDPLSPSTHIPDPQQLYTEEILEEPHEETPTVPPRRKSHPELRARSLSKVFNQLPPMLPTLKQMEMDMIEYMCHVCLLESNPARLQALRNSLIDLSLRHEIPPRGRLMNRIMLASLAVDIGSVPIEPNMDDDTSSAGCLLEMDEQYWKEVERRFIHLKSSILRRDANEYVASIREGETCDETGNDEENNTEEPIDEAMAQHEMVQAQFHEVLQLLRIHQIITQLRFTIIQNNEMSSALETYENRLRDEITTVPMDWEEVLMLEQSQLSPDVLMARLRSILIDDEKKFSLAYLQQKVSNFEG
jgi:hypothetical protein